MAWDRDISIKNPAEIALMREAGRVNALALAAVRELLQPGVTTADLNAAAEEILRKHGAYSPFKNYGQPPFPGSICASVNEELVHGIPGKRKLKEGDIISVDCGTVVEGYVGDAAFHSWNRANFPECQQTDRGDQASAVCWHRHDARWKQDGRYLRRHPAICGGAGVSGRP